MFKHYHYYLAFILSIVFLSCGKNEVEILSPEIEGDLEGCFIIAEDKVPVETDEKGNPFITLTVKRTSETLPFTPETVSTFSEKSNKALVLAGFGFEAFDKDDKELYDCDADENDDFTSEQLDVLKLGPNEESQLKIALDKNKIPSGIKVESKMEFISSGEISLEGAIGQYGVKNFTINFDYKTNTLVGQYQYKTSPAGAFLYLRGSIRKTSDHQGNYSYAVSIQEDNGKGNISGMMEGEMKLTRSNSSSSYYYELTGDFTNSRYQVFHAMLKSLPLEQIKYGNVLSTGYASQLNSSISTADEESTDASKGDSSVDEFIKAYKEFYKEYIPVLKKVSNGDPTAMAEYPKLLKKYQEYTTKLSKIKGDMSLSQIEEINEMNQELMKEMNDL